MSISRRVQFLEKLDSEIVDYQAFKIDPFSDEESYNISCAEYERIESLFINLYECIQKRDPNNPIIYKYVEEYWDLIELGFPPTWENRMDYAM